MTDVALRTGYSVANAERFGWAGFANDLLEPRVALFDRTVVGPRVLDAGCGSGAYVDYLAGRGFEATGLEKHDEFLARARERRYRGRFVQGDLADPLPFADGEFDTTFCCDVLEHVEDDYAALRELARVTRRRVVLSVPQDSGADLLAQGLVYSTYRDPTHLRYYTADMAHALARSVKPAGVTVRGDIPIRVEDIVRSWVKPRARRPGLTRVYERMFDFLMRRTRLPDLHLNWAVVIDLDGGGG
jgi:SAM-dependent methyltransferase